MAVDLGAKKTRGARPTINVTPLVDVVLVLLIIFMVVTPLLTKTFHTDVPEKPEESAAPAEPDDSAIVLTLDRSGVVRLNQATLSKSDVALRLRTVFSKRKERVVFFDAEDDAPFGDAVDVLDNARAGGAEQLAIATEPMSALPTN